MSTFWLQDALTPDGWQAGIRVEVDAAGLISSVEPGQAELKNTIALRGFVVPSIPNLHSHAFQRAMTGAAEFGDPARADSFWTWRTAMYRLAETVTPEQLEAIAAQLYSEMLESGSTSVGEFHYLHHDAGGDPYTDPAEMSRRILAAASTSGIGLTLLPVLYMNGGFDAPPTAQQRRFVHADVDAFAELLERIRAHQPPGPRYAIGVAPHSLRAVGESALADLLDATDEKMPVHIHIAEQQREVDEAVKALGARPVAWLLDRFAVSDRWCLVHATHIDDSETEDLARSGAIVGLCPTTEANLGDGIFPAAGYLDAGGRFGVGSDSHVCASAWEELRLLEYGARLTSQRRNRLVSEAMPHVGTNLVARAVAGGARAMGRPVAGIAVGQSADFVELDREHPRLVGHTRETVLDAMVLGGAERAVQNVFVAGVRVVDQGRHIARDAIGTRFRRAMQELSASA